MSIQGQDQRRSVLDDANPCVPVTVNPTLVALGQAKPTLQVQIVPDRFKLRPADEQARQETEHDPGHVTANRILGPLETIDQCLERLLTRGDIVPSNFEGCGNLLEVFDVVAERLLLGSHMVQAPVDARGQPSELLLGKPPFFSSRLRWIESRTSCKASAMRNPGG